MYFSETGILPIYSRRCAEAMWSFSVGVHRCQSQARSSHRRRVDDVGAACIGTAAVRGVG
ncbi:hypothetical protein BKA80DRAFT_264880 [Phyllosticta citrichinensis]